MRMLSNARIEARIPTQDLARARSWYAEKLGLEPVEEREGGLRYEGAAGVFCLFASAGASDGSFTQMGFYVDDIEAAVNDLRARGVVFEEYDGAVNGIMDIDGNYPNKGRGERAAWFRDNEDNMLGIAEGGALATGASTRVRPRRTRTATGSQYPLLAPLCVKRAA